MKKFPNGLFILVLAGAAVSCSEPASDTTGPTSASTVIEPKTIDLFNGVDLQDWDAFLEDPTLTKDDVWSVRDGLLICSGEPLGYLFTTTQHESFELLVEWRWAPGTEPGNSGVLMRINGEPRSIPRALEAQLMSGNAGDVYAFHGMRMEGPSERMRSGEDHELLGDFVGFTKSESAENQPGEWNKYEIALKGSNLVVHVNGKKVNEVSGCDVLPGPIGLQSEGGEIHFRTVQMTPSS